MLIDKKEIRIDIYNLIYEKYGAIPTNIFKILKRNIEDSPFNEKKKGIFQRMFSWLT
jgi:hypothetical protein